MGFLYLDSDKKIFINILKNSRDEAKVLQLRYGLEDNTIHTLEDIAKEFGITRERVRQLEVKAIRRLRHPSRLKIIK